MIYESLIAPHENPASLRDIKRALLTYEKVKIIDPNDRDIMPSTAFMSTLIGFPIIGMDMGPIRPMGKVLWYDDVFQKVVDDSKAAFKQDLIEIISTYKQEETKRLTIGGVATGGYPLNTKFIFHTNFCKNRYTLG